MSEVSEVVVGSKDDPKVKVYLDNAKRKRLRESALSMWHMKLYIGTKGEVELPWSIDETWTNLTVTDTVRDEETGNYSYPVNEQKTLARLAAVAKYAAKQDGVTVEKKYDSKDFELKVTIPVPGGTKQYTEDEQDTATLTYYASRELVCTKVVVGYEVIPARTTEEQVKEIVEWDCKPISLLGFDAATE